MKRIALTRPPDFIDDLGRPTYRVAQDHGLLHDMTDELLRRPTAAGYSAEADEAIFERVAAEVRRAAGAQADILEIGGGSGHFFERVRDHARSYINVEPGEPVPDPSMLTRLADPRYSAIRCTAESIPLPDASIDIIVAIASLDHVPDPDVALAEFARCLRPGGTLLVMINNAASWWKGLLRGTRSLEARQRLISADHYFQWSAVQCATELERRFGEVRVRTIRFVPYLPFVWRILGPAAELLGSRVAPLRGGDTIAVARRR